MKCMLRNGMYIGGHGYQHDWLDKLPVEKQESEINETLIFLRKIGAQTKDWAMAYPYGAYNDSLIEILKKNGCALAFTTKVDIANLTDGMYQASGSGSETHGYAAGGVSGWPTVLNKINKFPYATDSDATDWADLTVAKYGHRGTASTTYAYHMGGEIGVDAQNVIEKNSFASQSNATDVGDLTQVVDQTTACSY